MSYIELPVAEYRRRLAALPAARPADAAGAATAQPGPSVADVAVRAARSRYPCPEGTHRVGSGQDVPGVGEEAVPLLARQRDLRAGGRLLHPLGLRGAEDDLHVRGVPGDPGDRDAGRRHAVLRGEGVDAVV